MILKNELLRGTIEELNDYYYNELKVISRDNLDPLKELQYIEISNEKSIKEQLNNCTKETNKTFPYGIIYYLKVETNKLIPEEINLRVKTDHIFITNDF